MSLLALLLSMMLLPLTGCKTGMVSVPTPVPVYLPGDSASLRVVVDCPGDGLRPVVRMLNATPGKHIQTDMHQAGDTINFRAWQPPDTVTRYVTVSREPIEVPGPVRYINRPNLLQRIRMFTGDAAILALLIFFGPKIYRLIRLKI